MLEGSTAGTAVETAALLESSVVRSHVIADMQEEKAVKDRATPRSARSSGSHSNRALRSPFGTPRTTQSPLGSPRAAGSARTRSTPRTGTAFQATSARPLAARTGCLRTLANYIILAWNSQPAELAAMGALLPILDPVSDLAVFNQLLTARYQAVAAVLLTVLLLHWRFCVLYSALTPIAKLEGALVLYFPLLLLPCWGRAVGEEVTEAELHSIYAEVGGKLTPNTVGEQNAPVAAKPAARSPVVRPPPLALPRLPKLQLTAPGAMTMHAPSSPASPSPSPPPSPPSQVEVLVESPRATDTVRHSLSTNFELVGHARKRAPGTANRSPRYGTEAARVRSFVERHHASYARAHNSPISRLFLLITFELKLICLSVILGPFVLWRAALSLANGLAVPAAAEEAGALARLGTPRLFSPRSVTDTTKDVAVLERHLLHCRVLIFCEAACESLPQLGVQSVAFFLLDDALNANLYLFSAACSLGVVAFALISFAQHRLAVVGLVNPPKADYAAQVNALCDAAHVDAALLLASIATARDIGVPVTELKDAVKLLQDTRVGQARALKNKGSPPAMLMDAGYTSAELHAAGHTASQLREAGFSLESLEATGYTLAELNEAGYSAAQLHAAGHTLAELRAAGYVAAEIKALRAYSPTDLKGVGFSAQEMKIALYAPSELFDAGYSIYELKSVGCSVEELRDVGCTPNDLKAVGFSAAELKASNYSPLQLKSAGYLLSELQQVGYALVDLAAAQYSATELRGVGYSAQELRDEGFTAIECRRAAFAIRELRTAGFMPYEMRDAEYSVSSLGHAGYGAGELREAGFSAAQLKAAGYSTAEMRQASYTASELRASGITSAVALKSAGYTPAELKDARFSAAMAKAAGYTLGELKQGGYTATQLKTAGFVLSDFKGVGCTPSELRDAGYAAVQLRAAGFTAPEQIAGGYTAADLRAAGYSATDLKIGGLTAAQLREAGYPAHELHKAHYTPGHMMAAGYTARQMKEAGFMRNALVAAGYTDDDLAVAGCQSNEQLRAASSGGGFQLACYGADAHSA